MNILYRSRTYCSHKFRIYTRRKFKTLTPLWSWKPWEKVFDGSIKITVEIVSHFQTRSFTLNCGPRCGSPWALIYDTQPRRSRTEYKEKRKKKKRIEQVEKSSTMRERKYLALGNRWSCCIDRSTKVGGFLNSWKLEYLSFFNFSIFLFLQFVPWNFSIPETSLSPTNSTIKFSNFLPIFERIETIGKD